MKFTSGGKEFAIHFANHLAERIWKTSIYLKDDALQHLHANVSLGAVTLFLDIFGTVPICVSRDFENNPWCKRFSSYPPKINPQKTYVSKSVIITASELVKVSDPADEMLWLLKSQQ